MVIAEGVGWSLYPKGGKPAYIDDFLGAQRTTVSRPQPLAPGRVTGWSDFAYDAAGGMAKSAIGTLWVGDRKVGEGRIEHTIPMIFSRDETADVGVDTAVQVGERLGEGEATRFSGTIEKGGRGAGLEWYGRSGQGVCTDEAPQEWVARWIG